MTVGLQVTIQICQPHSKLKILSYRLNCGSCDAGVKLWIPNNKRAQRKRNAIHDWVISHIYVFPFVLFLHFFCAYVCKKRHSNSSQSLLWMTSLSCCGTNAPWCTPAGPSASQSSRVIIFIPLIYQIEMDTYDKNVAATPHVTELTGLRVTF